MLQQLGHRVDVAQNGQVAVRQVQAEAYDLVFMDMQMPVMDGLDATQAIRHLPEARFASLPIVAMTANVMRQDQARCLAAGMNDYIAKPIDPTGLAMVLDAWLPAGVGGQARPKENEMENSTMTVPYDIPGLDAAKGLSRVLGKASMYLSLLRRFADQERHAAADIRALLDRGERSDAERRVHTVKGIGATLGAADLQSDAMALELAIREQRPPGVLDERLAAFESRLSALVTALDERLPPAPGDASRG
jgi:two-component system, sensor histidine kinase and response regulator